MYRDRTKSPRGQNVRTTGSTSKAAPRVFFAPHVKEIMNRKVRSPLLKEIVAHADVSSILKEPGDAMQEDVGEESFNPPLHSTAVYTDDDELVQTNENPDQIPAKLMSPVPPVVQEKSVNLKSKTAINTDQSTPRPDTAKSRRTPQKKAQVPEPGSAKKQGASRNMSTRAPSLTQEPNITSNRSVVSAEKSDTQRKAQKKSSKKKSRRKDTTGTAPGDFSSPEKVPKSVRSVNELDVVHFECGKLIELYREKVETDVCKKAVDIFSGSFKEQIATTISDVRKLKDLKKKNAKMQSEIGRKRKRLLEVKNEIITKRPKLNQLQKEYSELAQKQESLKSTRVFLDNLAHLKDDYMKFKAENPHIKETYGMSSLPALCLETENIMKAEQHFHIVNKRLQSFFDREKGDG